jgi:hypothetical protein
VTTRLSSTTIGAPDPMTDLRRRFVDNDAPIVFSFNSGAGEAAQKLRRLVGLPAEWTGYDVDTPDAGAIVRAEAVIDQLQKISAVEGNWEEPHVAAGHDGEIVLEWWGDSKKITLYVSAEAVDCLRVWGPDMDAQMSERRLETTAELQDLWHWLRGE